MKGIISFIGKSDIWRQGGPEFVDEDGVHELILVRNVEAYDSLAAHCFRELQAKAVQVGFLGAENDVRPAEMPLGDDDARVRLRAGGADLVERGALEELLGGQAANPVAAANEEELTAAASGIADETN